MLFNYRNNHNYTTLRGNTTGAVAMMQLDKRNSYSWASHGTIENRWRKSTPTEGRDFYGYKQYVPRGKRPNLKARLRAACYAIRDNVSNVVNLLAKNSPGYVYRKAWSQAMATQLIRSVRKLEIDPDKFKTHLRFIPHNAPDNRKCRFRSMTFARFIKRQCQHIVKQYNLTDSSIERMDICFQIEPKLPKIQLVSGPAAYAVYRKGEIDSCMTGSDHTEHLFLANPEKHFLAIARIGTTLLFRTKVYKMDNGRIWRDRVYIRDMGGAYPERMIEAAIDAQLARHFKAEVSTNGDSYKITLHHESGESMPYLDYADRFDRIDDSTIKLHDRGNHSANNCDGTDDSCGRCCSCCESQINDNNCRTNDNGEEMCQDCYDDIYCYDDIGGYDISREDAVEITHGARRHIGQMTHMNNCEELSRDFYYRNSFALNDDTTTDYDGRTILQNDASCLHNGDSYHIDDQDIQELHDGEFAHQDDCQELDDGSYALPDDCCQLADESWHLKDDCDSYTIVDDYGNEITLWVAVDISELLTV